MILSREYETTFSKNLALTGIFINISASCADKMVDGWYHCMYVSRRLIDLERDIYFYLKLI